MKRPVFSSRIATVLTLIGVAVGLGNVWRFPYMMGQYGGSAFLFVYLGLTILFAIPALIAEMAFGRATRSGPVGAFKAVFGNTGGKIAGGFILISLMIAVSYYAVVIGNVLYATWFSVVHEFETGSLDRYHDGLGNGLLQYAITLVIVWISLYIIYRGLRKGIEPLSKVIVPLFLVVIAYLIIQSLSMEGAGKQMVLFLKPDFSVLGPDEIFAALGQTFFSVGLGANFMIIFGSYLPKEEKLHKIAIFTALGDVSAALLVSLFIIPAILVLGLDMASGPTLIFSTLPRLFIEMSGGWLMGSLFLVVLSLVAFLSLIAGLEVLTRGLQDFQKLKTKRLKIIIGIGITISLFALPSALKPELIGTLDLIFGSGMMVFGSAVAVLGLTWGLGKKITIHQIFGEHPGKGKQFFYFWIRWITPAALISVLLIYIYSLI